MQESQAEHICYMYNANTLVMNLLSKDIEPEERKKKERRKQLSRN